MLRLFICLSVLIICSDIAFAQTDSVYNKADTLQQKLLQEVIVISEHSLSDKTNKPLSTLDNYLEKANAVNMIRRGTYAWEPFLNGMASERSVITIDGMRIYGACTDKMDPVTSYVEITNLSQANVHSGQSGSTAGATIAGSLDLIRKKGSFGEKNFRSMVFTGFETNNQHKVLGTGISYSQPKFFTDVNLTSRGAENYKGGGGNEIQYSQFTKYNTSATVGYKIGKHRHIEAALIYDHAIDVGYPALPMDVSSAKAFIGSLEYIHHHISSVIKQWQTKIYYNEVTHIMDDTKRPVVPIRMDMPGWSKTAGFYSVLKGSIGKHTLKTNLSGHHNQSLAEMTMYSNISGQKDMFMLTWPDVHINYVDIFLEDLYKISDKWKATLSIGMGLHNNTINSSFGLASLQIFYPDMQESKTRLLKRFSANLQYEKSSWQCLIGLSYGERAPSISEAYGFYLFNSFDKFDYIGNPDMKNEQSLTFNAAVGYAKSRFSAKLSGAIFYIYDYIIGRPQSSLSPMTIGANGIKIYEQLQHANILNTTFDFNYHLAKNWLWTNKLSYRRGVGMAIGNLPLMQPFTYTSGINYSLKSFSADATVSGAAKQDKFNPEFGEKSLPDYAILNLSASQRLKSGKNSLLLKAGVENVFDKSYTIFADWNRLPRMGRNIFVNMVWNFN